MIEGLVIVTEPSTQTCRVEPPAVTPTVRRGMTVNPAGLPPVMKAITR